MDASPHLTLAVVVPEEIVMDVAPGILTLG